MMSILQMKTPLYVCLVIFSLQNALSFELISSDVIIKNVDRQVDVSTQLAKITSKLTVENTGKSAVKTFIYAVEPQFKNLVAFIGAQVCMPLT